MMSDQLDIYKLAVKENMVTVSATALCVGMVAIGTGGSLHCFWALVILLNMNTFKSNQGLTDKVNDERQQAHSQS